MDQQQALSALSAMANATRLEIVRLLVPHGAEGLSAGAIAADLGISASALSFHLSTLEQAGILTSKKCSWQVFYSADYTRLGGVIGYLLNDCCGAHPEVCNCSQPPAP